MMSTKLPISTEHSDFEIYQEMFDNDKVFIKLENFSQYMGSLEVKNGSMTIGIKYETFERIVKTWEAKKHLFETEFLELVSDIESILAELDIGESEDQSS
jgi:hypothetical protein